MPKQNYPRAFVLCFDAHRYEQQDRDEAVLKLEASAVFLRARFAGERRAAGGGDWISFPSALTAFASLYRLQERAKQYEGATAW